MSNYYNNRIFNKIRFSGHRHLKPSSNKDIRSLAAIKQRAVKKI